MLRADRRWLARGSGHVPLLSGLAGTLDRHAVAAARNDQKLGAEGLMAFPSLAYRTDRRETVAWYKAVAQASDTDVKLVQYIKLAEHFVHGAPEHTRKPRLAIEGDERAMVEAIIKATIADLGRSA